MSTTDRFFCPYPGCHRSFIDLWRLKVHYRADPDVRGSGRERGHGSELPACPKCNKTLERGRHHVRCKAGRVTPSQTQRKWSELEGKNKGLPPRKRHCASKRDLPVSPLPAIQGTSVESPWLSGKMLMMPCNVHKGFIFSAQSEKGVKLISGHAFFVPSRENQKAYFIPVKPSP